MSTSTYSPIFCSDNRRRDRILSTPGLNGIDYIEVTEPAGCGTRLAVTFLKDARGLALTANNFAISGDTVLTVTGVLAPTKDDPLSVTVALSGKGNFSPYTLMLVTSAQANYGEATKMSLYPAHAGGCSCGACNEAVAVEIANPDAHQGIYPQLAAVSFSFKVGCPSPADCLPSSCCPSSSIAAPDINYLARDYDGFRQLMLDRMAVLVPGWTELHAADPGITLVEALAYAADQVSYLQDAVNTEAYIGTARSRISLRRHARLVDYFIGEGANARAWVCLTASPTADGLVVPKGTQIFPLVPGLPAMVKPESYAASLLTASASSGQVPVFESLADLTLHPEQNEMEFYTWGGGSCCLPVGTTQATLVGVVPEPLTTLAAGQVLVFEELIGPVTGDPADADPTHRWAVRLTSATTVDHSGNPLVDPVNGTLLTSISWNAADALPFTLCISSVTDASHGSLPLSGVSVARGNVLAADQGVWTVGEALGVVPDLPASPVSGSGCNCSAAVGPAASVPRYRPVLANGPLTFAAPYDAAAAAATFLAPDTADAVPQITLTSSDGTTWTPLPDLLEQDAEFTGFVAEIEADGSAHLRFGDGVYGSAPERGESFAATYKTGNGTAGNVGRQALAHILFEGAGAAQVTGVRNPLAATGGVDAEGMDHIRQVAPFQFHSQLRCVTADDYGTMAETLPGVREARGTIRWTGSWYTAFTAIDPASAQLTCEVESSVKAGLNRMRMMGTDLVVQGAVFVGLRVGLEVCLDPGFFRGDVRAALLKVLVTGDACNGVTAVLDPANFKFGERVYASPAIAAAQSVPGVLAVRLTLFERQDSPTPANAAPPMQLTMGRLEIPRCDNDPNHADRGLLVLTLDGGK